MTSDADTLRARLWRELASLRTGMLGPTQGESQPMTAHFDAPDGALWFIARAGGPQAAGAREPQDAVFTYTGRGHDLYARVSGKLVQDPDPSILDRFWTPEVARWFPDWLDAALLRFEPDQGQVWIPGESAEAHEISFQDAGRRTART